MIADMEEFSLLMIPRVGLKKVETPTLAGYQKYINYVRPHEGLRCKTPTEDCNALFFLTFLQ